MEGRFRKSDLFALVGLVALLVWAPGYLAADPATRSLVDGETFTLPQPRDGDRIVFELVIREQGKDPEVVGPIGEMTRRLAEPGEVPRDAAWVEEWSYASGRWNLSIGGLIMIGGAKAYYYDSDGSTVWRMEDGNTGSHPSLPGSPINAEQGRYRYTSDVVAATTRDIGRYTGVGGDVRAVTEALLHRDAVLIGGETAFSRLWDRYFDIGDSHLSTGFHDRVILPWMFHNQGNLIFDPMPSHYSVEEWKWYHPEAAGAVGYHFGYAARGSAPFLQIDIVPRSIERGEGAVLPVTPASSAWDVGNTFPRERLEPADVPFIPLAELDQDPRPVFDAVSLPMLRKILETRPGWETAFGEGAHIVGFHVRHTETDVGANWTVILLDQSDRATMGHVRLDMEGAVVSEEVTCSDLEPLGAAVCSGIGGMNEPFVCHSLHTKWDVCPRENPDALDLDRMIPDPWALWDAVDLHQTDRVEMVLTPEPDVGPTGPSRLNPFRQPLTSTGGVHPHMGYTELRNQDDGTRYRWNLMDGRIDQMVTPPEEAEDPLPLTAEASSEQLATPIGFVPATVATGGLLLIGISVLARGWGLVRLVGFGAFAALYARIEDDAVLDHERREEIMRVVRAEPGLTATELSARVGLAWGVTAHHLERLRRAGLVQTRRDGRRNHHFPADVLHPEALISQRNLEYEAFLDLVTETPGLALRDLAGRLGRGRSTLSRTGSRLVRLGLVEKRRDGMVVRFYPRMHGGARPGNGVQTAAEA